MANRKVVLSLGLMGVLLISSLMACQTPAGRTAGEVIDDATITTKVKAKLFDESVLRGFAISVKTFGNGCPEGARRRDSRIGLRREEGPEPDQNQVT